MDLVTFYMTVRSYWIVWVMLLFVGMIVWVYWPNHRAAMDAHARIPLDDDAQG